MNAIYRFTTQGICSACGKLGQIRGGYVCGDYTLLDALLWAVEDLLTQERGEPFLVASNGEVFLDAAKVREETGILEGDPEGACACIGTPKWKRALEAADVSL